MHGVFIEFLVDMVDDGRIYFAHVCRWLVWIVIVKHLHPSDENIEPTVSKSERSPVATKTHDGIGHLQANSSALRNLEMLPDSNVSSSEPQGDS